MPNKEQMDYLCHRHYQSLDARNPVLAGCYDAVVSIDPMRQTEPNHNQVQLPHGGKDHDQNTDREWYSDFARK
jgi:hypothetical protein